mmetsp:Transcript_22692/g.57507  ORF Transcript_22692/g.57507 Transcript_22692/m.57507 type:complete len:254 (-) Transcript_22692:873-1634(-)
MLLKVPDQDWDARKPDVLEAHADPVCCSQRVFVYDQGDARPQRGGEDGVHSAELHRRHVRVQQHHGAVCGREQRCGDGQQRGPPSEAVDHVPENRGGNRRNRKHPRAGAGGVERRDRGRLAAVRRGDEEWLRDVVEGENCSVHQHTERGEEPVWPRQLRDHIQRDLFVVQSPLPSEVFPPDAADVGEGGRKAQEPPDGERDYWVVVTQSGDPRCRNGVDTASHPRDGQIQPECKSDLGALEVREQKCVLRHLQ